MYFQNTMFQKPRWNSVCKHIHNQIKGKIYAFVSYKIYKANSDNINYKKKKICLIIIFINDGVRCQETDENLEILLYLIH